MTAETSIDIDSLGAKAGDRLPNTVETQWNLAWFMTQQSCHILPMLD